MKVEKVYLFFDVAKKMLFFSFCFTTNSIICKSKVQCSGRHKLSAGLVICPTRRNGLPTHGRDVARAKPAEIFGWSEGIIGAAHT